MKKKFEKFAFFALQGNQTRLLCSALNLPYSLKNFFQKDLKKQTNIGFHWIVSTKKYIFIYIFWKLEDTEKYVHKSQQIHTF